MCVSWGGGKRALIERVAVGRGRGGGGLSHLGEPLHVRDHEGVTVLCPLNATPLDHSLGLNHLVELGRGRGRGAVQVEDFYQNSQVSYQPHLPGELLRAAPLSSLVGLPRAG